MRPDQVKLIAKSLWCASSLAIAMGYRGYWPTHRGNDFRGQCRLDAGCQAVRPRKGLPSCYLRYVVDNAPPFKNIFCAPGSLVKMGTTASQKKLFFTLRKAKSRMSPSSSAEIRLLALRRLKNSFFCAGGGAHLHERPGMAGCIPGSRRVIHHMA